MAVLEIKKAGAPVLKEVCLPVERVDKGIRNLLDDMAETMTVSDLLRRKSVRKFASWSSTVRMTTDSSNSSIPSSIL